MLSSASALPIFTPALGYTYMPPVPKPTSSAAGSLQATQASKETTPMPDTQSSLLSSKAPLASGKASATDIRGTALLSGSLKLASRFDGEFMDENPLVGEPGSFILQKAREQPSQSTSQTLSQTTSMTTSQATTTTVKSTEAVKASAPPTPAPLKTEGLPPAEKKVKGEKTPVTPGTAGKKRKKSKAAIPAVGTAVGTPK